ncbi:MAG: hypothetical protein ABSB30_13915 [Terracidiphilus sp.]
MGTFKYDRDGGARETEKWRKRLKAANGLTLAGWRLASYDAGWKEADGAESLAAIDVGVNLLDTGDFRAFLARKRQLIDTLKEQAAIPAEAVAGTRYDAAQMKVLDSEK